MGEGVLNKASAMLNWFKYESLLRKKLKDQHVNCYFKDLMKDLQQIQASFLVYPDGKTSVVRAGLPGISYLAFQALHIKPPALSTEVSVTGLAKRGQSDCLWSDRRRKQDD